MKGARPMLANRELSLLTLLDWSGRSTRNTWLGVFALLLPVYVLTSHWWTGQNADGIAAAWPAWQLVHHGTPDLSGLPGLPENPWFLDAGDRLVSNRTMGVVLAGVPLSAGLFWTDLTPDQLGALSAAVLTAAAMANTAAMLRSLVSARLAVAVTLVLALGTPVWTVAAAELWTHGPNAFWLSLGLLLVSRDRLVLAGLALSPVVVTRPHLALVVACIGVGVALSRRSPLPLLWFGVPGAAAVGALMTWNATMFGAASIGGGYDYAAGNATGSIWAPGVASAFLTNVAGTLVSGWCGALLFSPVFVVVLLSLPAGWRAAPAWARAAALGGLLYLAVQFRINSFTGGGLFYGNRLIIELLVLATPLAAVGYTQWSTGSALRPKAATVLAWVSIGVFTTGAALADYRVGGDFSDWTAWYPYLVVRAAGPAGVVVVSACAAAGVGALLVMHRPRSSVSAPAVVPAAR